MLRIQRQQTRALAQGNRTPGFTGGHFRANQASAIFPLQRQQVPARIQHRHGQWRRIDLAACGQRGIHQAYRDFQVQNVHEKVLFLL
ncbi:hypothetical protein D3C80_1686460 [compost metagenome]